MQNKFKICALHRERERERERERPNDGLKIFPFIFVFIKLKKIDSNTEIIEHCFMIYTVGILHLFNEMQTL